MKYLRKFFNEFIFGNYFIALCALAMIFTTDLLNNIPVHFSAFTIFILASTYLLYNFHRHSFSIDYSNRSTIKLTVGKIRLKPSEIIAYSIAVLLIIIYFFKLHSKVYLYLIPLAILSIGYSAPLIKTKGKKKRLKELFFIKTPLLALVWALSTTVIPLVEQNISLLSLFVFWQIVSRTLFIFALCIPFELRDEEIDRKNNVSTLAVVHGIKITKIIGIIVILLELMTHHMMNVLSINSKLALDLSSIAALLLILFQDNKRSASYYKFLVDGTMILRFLLLYLITAAT